MALCVDDLERVAIFNRLLRRLLHEPSSDASRRLFAAVRSVESRAECGQSDVRQMAQDLGMGIRSLERLFAQGLGISPKRYLRFARLQQAMQYILDPNPKRYDWAQISVRIGCSDQSHLIHEFQDFCGMTPADFARIPNVAFTLAYGAVILPSDHTFVDSYLGKTQDRVNS